jgi:hypothetical protein
MFRKNNFGPFAGIALNVDCISLLAAPSIGVLLVARDREKNVARIVGEPYDLPTSVDVKGFD